MKSKALVVAVGLLAAVAACGDDDGPAGANDGGAGGEGGEAAFSIDGLSAPVEVSFDEQGVLHASCDTDEDCAAVLGYFHARDRFYQMDLFRRVARGRASSLISLYGVEQDAFMRQFMSTRDGTPIEEAIWAEMDEDTRAIVEAYAAGVNAWLADLRAEENGATLTREYRVPVVNGDPAAIPDWEPLDTVAFARLMTWQLSESSDVELGYGPAFANLPAERAVALFTLAPAARTYTLPASGESYGQQVQALRSREGVDLHAIRKVQERINVAQNALDLAAEARRGAMPFGSWGSPGEPAGSNNWVVAPSRTVEGKALLANDPHLSLSNPPVWYFAELDAKTEGQGSLHVAGGTFPGIPGVPIGRNENVAWGATVAYYDVTDVYVEQLTEDNTAVLFDADGDGSAEEVPLVTREVSFEVFGSEPQTRTLRWVPHHGPVISIDEENHTAVSVRWTGHEPTNELKAFLDLGRAADMAEAREALRTFQVGAQNFVLIDTDGKIGWWPHATVPKRPWASFNEAAPGEEGSLPPWLPLPGDGSAEWEGFLSDEELPQMWDPAGGFVATANQPMTAAQEDGDPTNDGIPVIQTAAAVGFRETRIVELLEEIGDQHSVETMHRIQADTHSLPGEAIVPGLLAAADAAEGELSEQAQILVDALRAWAFTCPTGLATSDPKGDFSEDEGEARESAGCAAFHYTLRQIYQHAYGDELEAAFGERPPYAHDVLIRPLTLALTGMEVPFDPDLLWDDMETEDVTETRDEVLLAAIEAAASQIRTHLGADSNRWRWGRVHTLTLGHDLAAFPGQEGLAYGPWANDGGLYTVDVANPAASGSGANFGHGSGASLRFVSEADETGIRSWLQLPGGQDLHRGAEHYNDLFEDYLANEPFALPFTREEAAAAAVTEMRIAP